MRLGLLVGWTSLNMRETAASSSGFSGLAASVALSKLRIMGAEEAVVLVGLGGLGGLGLGGLGLIRWVVKEE